MNCKNLIIFRGCVPGPYRSSLGGATAYAPLLSHLSLCDLSHPSVPLAPSVPKYGSLRSPQLDMKWELPFLKLQVCLENFKYLGCKNTDLKTVLYCQKCLMGVYEVQKPQNFPGATPPDSCRSSLGGAMRHLGRISMMQLAALAAEQSKRFCHRA